MSRDSWATPMPVYLALDSELDFVADIRANKALQESLTGQPYQWLPWPEQRIIKAKLKKGPAKGQTRNQAVTMRTTHDRPD